MSIIKKTRKFVLLINEFILKIILTFAYFTLIGLASFMYRVAKRKHVDVSPFVSKKTSDFLSQY